MYNDKQSREIRYVNYLPVLCRASPYHLTLPRCHILDKQAIKPSPTWMFLEERARSIVLDIFNLFWNILWLWEVASYDAVSGTLVRGRPRPGQLRPVLLRDFWRQDEDIRDSATERRRRHKMIISCQFQFSLYSQPIDFIAICPNIGRLAIYKWIDSWSCN